MAVSVEIAPIDLDVACAVRVAVAGAELRVTDPSVAVTWAGNVDVADYVVTVLVPATTEVDRAENTDTAASVAWTRSVDVTRAVRMPCAAVESTVSVPGTAVVACAVHVAVVWVVVAETAPGTT